MTGPGSRPAAPDAGRRGGPAVVPLPQVADRGPAPAESGLTHGKVLHRHGGPGHGGRDGNGIGSQARPPRGRQQCLERLREPEFAEHIRTDHRTVPQVADRVSRSAGLAIAPNTGGPLRARLRRCATGLRHIRFDRPGEVAAR